MRRLFAPGHPKRVSSQEQGRISVLRDNHIVPLLPACHHASPQMRQPWQGILLEQHAVAAIEIPEHEHGELCLHLQTSGDDAMEWWSGGRNSLERTSPGSMLLVPAGTRDRIRWQGASNRLLLTLSPEWMNQIAEEAGAPVPEFIMNWSLRDAALERLIADMGHQAAEGWPLGRLYADLTAAGLISQLVRRYAVHPVSPAEVQGGLPVPLLRRAMEFMTANLASDLRLEQIAGETGLSAFHFARGFRAATGATPYQYLLDQRIDRSKYLLRTRNWPVQEIAQMTGFHSPVNFVRSFRQRVGLTPGAWRKAN
ncbi:MAG: AraC family transcriptional regulator [Edaphobacter sp.]|uniref:helix-turn-helix domain-containing protein n=1 Tax=Edaphobacter sp. TaxID=1934404 RepID=UPI00239748C9|nr:AraC family transcriptional regulator [Edaphobacter sp.]MDE1176041.1 AraC family transcriptional regulator [Edaphobacter sp.]